MKEKYAAIVVFVVLATVPALVFFYQYIYRPSLCTATVIPITGVGARGVWTLEAVNGLNYWWKAFEPATIHVRLNDSVVFRFHSADVFHQFYVPELGIGPVDVEPGYVKDVPFTADKAGVFHYYCTSMCGGCHFFMQGWIVVTRPGDKPATPRPISCSLCLPVFQRPAATEVVALGEYLYMYMGCVTCHGIDGRGGVENYNYINRTVPAHHRTAEKIFLTDEDDRDAFLALIKQGRDPNRPGDPPDISRYRIVLSRFNAAVELIEKGKNAARLDMAGPEPPLQMPTWKDKLERKQIFAIIGYFLSLASDDDTDSGDEASEI